ncbi:MAG: hypothetical protein ACI9OJ_000674 [Myxococcota bacterium]|jgi:hypothetical protein
MNRALLTAALIVVAVPALCESALAEEVPPRFALPKFNDPNDRLNRLNDLDLDIRMQAQFVFLAGLPAADGGIASGELQINGSLFGIGIVWGLIVEDQTADDGARFLGGSTHIALQYRFVAQLSRTIYPFFDPHIDLGFMLGGGEMRDEARFRGSVYVGAGIDVPLQFAKRPQVVATVQYRFMAGQTPDDLETHLMIVGIGLRFTQDGHDDE